VTHARLSSRFFNDLVNYGLDIGSSPFSDLPMTRSHHLGKSLQDSATFIRTPQLEGSGHSSISCPVHRGGAVES
jgi:hypothetical protein